MRRLKLIKGCKCRIEEEEEEWCRWGEVTEVIFTT
jgi:hypothetical protein